MNIEFATCVKTTAFGYLQKDCPTKTITEDQVSKLLDLVSRDIVRIQDPYMYGNRIGIIQGRNYKSENMPEINEAIAQMKENDLI